MRVSETVVLGARLGGKREFEALVKAYEASLFALALASTRNRAEAEDVVQEVFLKASTGIASLREAGRFESWLYALARNELASLSRKAKREPRVVDLDPDQVDGVEAGLGGSEEVLLEEVYASLSPDQALVVALRYGGDLSLREVALACGLPLSTAKSRLEEARRRMRRAGAGAPNARTSEPLSLKRFRIPFGLEERIMESVETLRLGAYIVARLSLEDQMALAGECRRGEAFSEASLLAIGRVEGGGEFIRRVGPRLSIKEFSSTLNYADRYTEKRLVEGLEARDPETAEAIKRSMFVFEDFVLFSPEAFALLMDEVGDTVIALGIWACDAAIREELLQKLEPSRQARIKALLRSGASSQDAARAAQEEAVAFARRLDQEKRLKVLQGPEHPRGFVFVVA